MHFLTVRRCFCETEKEAEGLSSSSSAREPVQQLQSNHGEPWATEPQPCAQEPTNSQGQVQRGQWPDGGVIKDVNLIILRGSDSGTFHLIISKVPTHTVVFSS